MSERTHDERKFNTTQLLGLITIVVTARRVVADTYVSADDGYRVSRIPTPGCTVCEDDALDNNVRLRLYCVVHEKIVHYNVVR